jgi:hypothetical protein
MQCLHRKTNPSFVEEEAPIRNMYVSKRELKFWSWILRRLKPGMTVLAKASSSLTDLLKSAIHGL